MGEEEEEELVVKDALTGNDKWMKIMLKLEFIGFTEKKIKCIMEIC